MGEREQIKRDDVIDDGRGDDHLPYLPFNKPELVQDLHADADAGCGQRRPRVQRLGLRRAPPERKCITRAQTEHDAEQGDPKASPARLRETSDSDVQPRHAQQQHDAELT